MGEQVHHCVVGPSDVVEDAVSTGQNIVLERNKSNDVDEKVIAGLNDVEGFARCVCCQKVIAISLCCSGFLRKLSNCLG
jgi:hypothetical protein